MMQEDKPTKRGSAWTWTLFGFFFFYLAIDQGEINGNSVPLFLIGIGFLCYGILISKPVHAAICKRMGIVEIDLTQTKEKEEKKHKKP